MLKSALDRLAGVFRPWQPPGLAHRSLALERTVFVYFVPAGVLMAGVAWPQWITLAVATSLVLMFFFAMKTRTWG